MDFEDRKTNFIDHFVASYCAQYAVAHPARPLPAQDALDKAHELWNQMQKKEEKPTNEDWDDGW